MKKNLMIALTLLTVTFQNAQARGFDDVRIMDCDGASITIGHDYQATGSVFQKLNLSKKAIHHLLTEDTGYVKNREYFLGKNSDYHISPSIDLNKDVELAKYIVTVNGVEIETNDPVSSIHNYYGSLSERTSGKQIRVLYNRETRVLSVSLFNSDSTTRVVSAQFGNCR